MQKIIIKKFGAVKDAEIEIKKILVLIGEQASGKSTIAKLIYFFKSLRDELFNQIYQDDTKDYFRIPNDLIFTIREKFYDFFGSTYHLSDFQITHYYNLEEKKYLRLTLDKNKRKLLSKFSNSFLTDNFKDNATKIKQLLQKEPISENLHDKIAYEQNKYKDILYLSDFVKNAFCTYHNSALFVIAGRNATVSYTELFEKYLFANLQSKIEDIKQQSFKKKEQTIDETLMLSFIERVAKIKSLFNKYGNFNGLVDYFSKNKNDESIYNNVIEKIDEILKGKYIIDRWGEKIIINDYKGQYVYLHNSSSGQQEAIRILQDIFLVLIEKQKALRIIEEPEAHLFPVAQKLVVELLAYFVNQGNELIITTHSPYVLTAFNNLLFAGRVVEKNSKSATKVNKIINYDIRLKQDDFAAYSLTGNVQDETQKKYCENIINAGTGLINLNNL